MLITVEDVLQLDAMQGVNVIAGAEGLGRQLNSVTVLDAPDAVSWLKGHELVLTSTFPLMRRRQQLDRMVEDMAARGVAGLGVKLNRFMTELPPAMLRRADDQKLPILSLPMEIAWIDVINPIFAQVMTRNGALVSRSEPIRNSFNELLLAGADLQDFLDALGKLIQKPVLVHSPANRLRMGSTGYEQHDMAAAVTGIVQVPTSRTRLLLDTHDVYEMSLPVGRLAYCLLDPNVDPSGILAVLDQARNLTESDLRCLKHARDAISIKLLQSRAETSIAREKQNEFVQGLLDSSLSEAALKKLLRRGRERGYRLYERYVVAMVKFPRMADNKLLGVTDILHPLLAAEDILVGWFGNGGFLLLVPERAEAGFSTDGGASYMESLLRELSLQAGLAHWHAGMSQILSVERLAPGAEQAEYALQRSMKAEKPCELKLHDETSLQRIFSHPAIQQGVQSYVQEWLEPLIQYDQRHQSRLIETLKVFIENNGNYREAARLLHVHHNTVRYRIGQIERLTRRDIQQPKLRFQYQLALHLFSSMDND